MNVGLCGIEIQNCRHEARFWHTHRPKHVVLEQDEDSNTVLDIVINNPSRKLIRS